MSVKVLSKLTLLVIGCAVIVTYIIQYRNYSQGSSIVTKYLKNYDFIIVGAGTAGCVLAARLSENANVSVLLIEAGDKMSYFTQVPMIPNVVQLGVNDWSYLTVPQKYSSFGMWNQSQRIPRGKGLGGSGQINYMLHGLGAPQDFHNWAKMGATGWDYDDLKPYFMKVFGSVDSEFDSYDSCSVTGECSAAQGPMKLKKIDTHDPLMNIFKEASAESETKEKITFKLATSTILDGTRLSSYQAYLKPVLRRKNLNILLNTMAVTVAFDNKRASSVYIFRKKLHLDNIFANKEIILSGGVINTPQLLTLSGIGPREVLNRHGITPVQISEGVGENLHDHINMPLYVTIQKPISVTLDKLFTFSTLFNYMYRRQGLLSYPPVSGTEFVSNKSALILFAMGSVNERVLRDLSNYKSQSFRGIFPHHNNTNQEGFTFLASCLKPFSRGRVWLRDARASTQPLVDPNYLFDDRDIQCMISAIRRAIQLLDSKSFRSIGARIAWPRLEACEQYWPGSSGILPNKESEVVPDAFLQCVVRHAAVTAHHAAGTCSMAGSKPVLNTHLQVLGVKSLRVVDASVMPAPVSLYPNSVLIALAEKAADIILKNNFRK